MSKSYGCPYRSKHVIKIVKGSDGVQMIYYCNITHQSCQYTPSKCPILKSLKNKSILDYITQN